MKLLVVSAALFCACSFASARDPLPTLDLTVGDKQVVAEVASSQEARERGLMMRKSLAENSGMLFTFDEERNVCMWMKDTPLPLSVAFIDLNGNIVSIREMEPNTLKHYCSPETVLYALEMNANWFANNNVKKGAKVKGLPKHNIPIP